MKEVKVAITGAAGQIGYATLFRLASGEIFGKDTKVHLQLLELEPALPALEGVRMELDDCAFPLLASITTTSDLKVAFNDVDWALLIGSVPRKAGMERKDLLKINGGIFIDQGKTLDEYAKETCKVLVVGNPCNTNAYIAKSVCKRIPKENFYAMTMLDQKRAVSQLANRSKVENSLIKNVIIWGNHSSTQYPNFYNATIDGKSVVETIDDENWLQGEFISQVQQRGAAIIKARGASSAASAANAALESVKEIINPTPLGEHFSLAVCSDESYGIKEGLIFSYPVRSNGEKIEIVQEIELNDFSKEKIKLTEKELLEEVEAVKELLV